MSRLWDDLDKAYKSIEHIIPFEPDIAIVLGSGLGDFADNMKDCKSIPYSDIDGFPVSTVAGHSGEFVFGTISGKRIVAMKGRVHYYEGYSMDKVVMPIRLMKLMGIKKLILTNAAGGVNYDFNPADLMIITDHITSFTSSPLIGENVNELGTRFPDMSSVYDNDMRNIMKRVAEDSNINVREGVYLQTTGPNYETPAEVRMYRLLGADAVGMSTACEAMVAAHMGIPTVGVSCITNMATGVSDQKLSHEEVGKIAALASKNFSELIIGFIKCL